jgi:hypothetical protein
MSGEQTIAVLAFCQCRKKSESNTPTMKDILTEIKPAPKPAFILSNES